MPDFRYPSRIRSRWPSPLRSASWAATWPSGRRRTFSVNLALSVTEEDLHASKVARHHDVREPIAVDGTGDQGGVRDIDPSRRDRGEDSFPIARPDGRAGFYEARSRHLPIAGR